MPYRAKTASPDNKHAVRCHQCAIRKLCLPVMLAESEIDHLETIIERGATIKKGQPLFHAGEPFEAIYAVRSGSFVSSAVNAEGQEMVTGFYLPGEIIGLDGIHSKKHPTTAKALETSSVCVLPFERLQEIAAVIPSLQRQLFNVMSSEIQSEHELMMLLGRKSADERLAAFFINLSQRFKRRGLSAERFRLSMTRGQIGRYLGLAVETVSRLLTKFSEDGLIHVQDREIEILDMPRLSQLAGTACHHPD